MPWCSARTRLPAISTQSQLKNFVSGQRAADSLLQHLHRVRPLHLEAVQLPLAGRVHGGALVALER
jgi:hypothetical protein